MFIMVAEATVTTMMFIFVILIATMTIGVITLVMTTAITQISTTVTSFNIREAQITWASLFLCLFSEFA